MKKVLFTATVDSHIENFHIPYLKYFKEQGYEVHVATNGDDEIPYCDKKIKIPFERSPYKLNNLKAIKLLKKVIMEEKYGIIHTHTPMGSVVTRLAAAKARKKYHTRVIYTAHGFHFYKGAPKLNWLLFYPVEKVLSKITDTLITINQEDYELAKNKFWCKDVQYVPGVGIDEKKFNIKMTKKEKSDLRKSLGLKENDFVMIYVARLDKNKNQGFLIEVTRELIKTNPNVHLLLVGPDEYNGIYQEQAKDILSNVHFTGLRKDIPELLNISDVAVSSSLREGLPVNIIEALTVGLPVVATDARGVRDLLHDGKNGYVVNIGDINEFIYKINNIELLNNKKNKDYSIDNIFNVIKTIYNRKKRILHVLASNKFSGAENVVCTIIENMDDEYEMAYCSPYGDIEKTLKERNIKYFGLKKFNFINLKKVINKFDPDIIHAHDNKATVLSSLFYKKNKIISHIHGNNKIMNKTNFKSFLFNLITYKISYFIWVSNSSFNDYCFKDKISNKSIILYNIIDKKRVIKKSNDYLCDEEYDLIFLGRLGYPKNLPKLIEIIKLLKEKIDNINVAIVGDGPDRDLVKKLIHKYNLQKNIKMYGFQKNPYPILKNSNILIMTSIYEGTPMCALEAQALGKPIVATPVDGLLKVIHNGKNGYLEDSNELFVKSILKILDNKKYYIKNVNKLFDKYNNLNKYIKNIDSIYKKQLQGDIYE